MEHGPSDAGERGEGRKKAKSKAKESFKVSFSNNPSNPSLKNTEILCKQNSKIRN
jgi:hypothetical protein